MRLSTLAALTAAVLPSIVSATYFTSPAAGTVWSSAPGQTITWHYQAGGAPRGDIVLQSTSTNPKAAQIKVVATDVDLTSETVTVPAALGPSGYTSWTLLMVNSNNYNTVYTQVGPVTINSFTGAAAATPVAPASASSAGGAVGNGSGEADTATNPAVGISTTPSSSSSSATSETTTAPSVTATVLSTASGIEITSTLTANSASLANATTAGRPVSLVTLTASRSSATLISSSARAAATGAKSGVAGRDASLRWGPAVVAAALAAACVL